jgi:hypothetical protein
MTKLSTEARKKFYLEKMKEQQHLLQTAVDGMANGDLVQALHVATSIRVFVHETGGSKPLLKQLRVDYLALAILERVRTPPPGHEDLLFHCPVSTRIEGGVVKLIKELDHAGYSITTLGAWWENACMILPSVGRISRRELILGLSNKEGGAHVDADITEKYQNLLESKFFNIKINDMDPSPVNVSRTVAGKCGVELLDCLERNFPGLL